MLGLQGRSRAHVTPSPEFKVSCSRVSELAGYRQRQSAAVRVGVGAGGMRGGQFGGGGGVYLIVGMLFFRVVSHDPYMGNIKNNH